MTLELWSMGVVRPIMEVHPYSWTFFISFIFIVTFIMINLIVAVVDAMAEINSDSKKEIVPLDVGSEIVALREEIQELKNIIMESRKND